MKFFIKQWIQSYLPPAILNNLIHKKNGKISVWKDPRESPKRNIYKTLKITLSTNLLKKTNRKKSNSIQQFYYIKNISHF